MPSIIRSLIDFSTGHCFEPRPCLTGSPNVFVNGSPVVRVGDDYLQIHVCGIATHPMGPALIGSPNVFVNNSPVHRSGDLITCGDTGGFGSSDVLANQNF